MKAILKFFLAIVVITMTYGQGVAQKTALTGKEKGHDWVDMGTRMKWATCNVGASTPSDYGYYYGWGETSKLGPDNTLFTSGNWVSDISGKSLDSATANWGGKWRMPTQNDWKELIDKCTWEWKDNGYEIKSSNGNKIFLPCAGLQEFDFNLVNNQISTKLLLDGSMGYYWSSTPNDVLNDTKNASMLAFGPRGIEICNHVRTDGLSIRPVLE